MVCPNCSYDNKSETNNCRNCGYELPNKDILDDENDNELLKNIAEKAGKVGTVISNIYFIIFFTFWFGFLLVFDYKAIETWDDGGNQLFMLSIMFWIAGIFTIIKKIRN